MNILLSKSTEIIAVSLMQANIKGIGSIPHHEFIRINVINSDQEWFVMFGFSDEGIKLTLTQTEMGGLEHHVSGRKKEAKSFFK